MGRNIKSELEDENSQLYKLVTKHKEISKQTSEVWQSQFRSLKFKKINQQLLPIERAIIKELTDESQDIDSVYNNLNNISGRTELLNHLLHVIVRAKENPQKYLIEQKSSIMERARLFAGSKSLEAELNILLDLREKFDDNYSSKEDLSRLQKIERNLITSQLNSTTKRLKEHIHKKPEIKSEIEKLLTRHPKSKIAQRIRNDLELDDKSMTKSAGRKPTGT